MSSYYDRGFYSPKNAPPLLQQYKQFNSKIPARGELYSKFMHSNIFSGNSSPYFQPLSQSVSIGKNESSFIPRNQVQAERQNFIYQFPQQNYQQNGLSSLRYQNVQPNQQPYNLQPLTTRASLIQKQFLPQNEKPDSSQSGRYSPTDLSFLQKKNIVNQQYIQEQQQKIAQQSQIDNQTNLLQQSRIANRLQSPRWSSNKRFGSGLKELGFL